MVCWYLHRLVSGVSVCMHLTQLLQNVLAFNYRIEFFSAAIQRIGFLELFMARWCTLISGHSHKIVLRETVH